MLDDVLPDELAFSGWLWHEPEGWLQARQRQWVFVVGGQLYMGATPCDDEFELLSLAGAEVTAGDGVRGGDLRVCNNDDGVDVRFSAESAYERAAWAAHLSAAALRGGGAAKGAYRRLAAALAELPPRPVVPLMDVDGGEPPERADPHALLCGPAHAASGTTWLGSPTWAPRWATVHDWGFTLRVEECGLEGLQVHPLRGARFASTPRALAPGSSGGVEVTWLEWSCPAVIVCIRAAAEVDRWCRAFDDAQCAANPLLRRTGGRRQASGTANSSSAAGAAAERSDKHRHRRRRSDRHSGSDGGDGGGDRRERRSPNRRRRRRRGSGSSGGEAAGGGAAAHVHSAGLT